MSDEYNGELSPAKLNKGINDLYIRCHCGKLRVNHASRKEALECQRISKTETVGRIMSRDEIDKMDPRKI